jgi:hypothetical protein
MAMGTAALSCCDSVLEALGVLPVVMQESAPGGEILEVSVVRCGVLGY